MAQPPPKSPASLRSPGSTGRLSNRPSVGDMKCLEAGAPLDYSFMAFKNVSEILYQVPVAPSGKPKNPPLDPDVDAAEAMRDMPAGPADDDAWGQSTSPTKSPSSGPRLNSCALRLSNNDLMELNGLDKVINYLYDEPRKLYWLDLACNKLASIDDVLFKYPNLRVLYLHGNCISSMAEALKLAKLPHLEKLTLHGNPIADNPQYKMLLLAHLPNLRSLDFSTVTKVDRDKINTWYAAYSKSPKNQRALT